MKIDEFKTGLVKYYGEHQSAHVTKVTLKYVESNYDENNYPNLMQAVMKSHPFNYGFPDVAAIEEAQDKLWKKDGKTLRKTRSSTEWTGESLPLTDEERLTAKEEHDKFIDHRDFIELEVNGASWCQSTYTFYGEELESRIKKLENHFLANNPGFDPDADDVFDTDEMSHLMDMFLDLEDFYDFTDYTMDEFKDENGETLEFVFSASGSYGFDVFGKYSLFFSPETRLVRIFFQCT